MQNLIYSKNEQQTKKNNLLKKIFQTFRDRFFLNFPHHKTTLKPISRLNNGLLRQTKFERRLKALKEISHNLFRLLVIVYDFALNTCKFSKNTLPKRVELTSIINL